jgi:hypothetical protein
MAWMILELLEHEDQHGLRPVVATNVKFYDRFVREFGIKRVRTISEIFDVVAEIDLTGERRNLYCFIDEFDGAEGQNAWETRGKEAGASFRVFNQMRKTQEIIMVPAIHYPQDVNSRWRESLQGVHCILNKGKYYPPQGHKDQWDCVRYTDDMEALESVAIYWKGMPINFQFVPNVAYSFETFANTFFTFDYLPRDVLNMMEAIDRIPLPRDGTEDERIDWLIERGRTIQRYNTEWRASKEAQERMLLDSQEAQEYKAGIMEEAVELFDKGWTIRSIHSHLLEEHAEDRLSEVLPEKFEAFKTAFRRFRGSDAE